MMATPTLPYDAIVLGSGPAGYTAGIYLARFRFRTLLLDTLVVTPERFERGAGRSSTPGLYYNVPGFPEGIERSELKWRGIEQAKNAGCDYQIDRTIAITQQEASFTVHGETGTYHGKNLFLAMGIEDDWTDLPGLAQIVGHSLFWSVEVNGKEAEGKPAAVIGHNDFAVEEVIQLHLFTPQAFLLTHGQKLNCSEPEKMKHLLAGLNIPVFEQKIKTIQYSEGSLEKIILANHEEVVVNTLFSPSEFQRPRSELAQNLGVHVESRGYIVINDQYETNIPHVYAMGDITTSAHKQVLGAYYQGMQAAWALYRKRLQEVLHHIVVEEKDSLLEK